jgi:hypothetical protein
VLSFRVGLGALCLAASAIVHAQDISPAVEAIATAGAADPPHLDSKLRMQEYLKSLIRPSAVLSNILIAGMEEGRNFPHEWGRTGTAFEKRLGSQFAQYFLDSTIEVGVSGMLHEDNRYKRLGTGGFARRFGNVVKSTVIVASTNGGQTLALGQIAGAYGSWAIASQVWEPPSEQRGSRILVWGSVNLAAKGARNLIKEFGPDLKHKPAAPAHP